MDQRGRVRRLESGADLERERHDLRGAERALAREALAEGLPVRVLGGDPEEAVRLVAAEGWKLLPDYRFDLDSGLWHHRGGAIEPPLRLADVSYETGTMAYPRHRVTAPVEALAGYLDEARALFAAAPDRPASPAELTGDLDELRWFELPAVCLH